MAMADLVMPRLPDQQQGAFFQAPFHQPHQQPAPYPSPQYHPQISPLSTSNSVSPTSPKNYHTRQVRPLYMPAVLRPTEFPPKANGASPKAEDDDGDVDRVLRSNASFVSLSGLSVLGRLSRRSTGDSGKCMDGEWNLDLFPKVSGLPKRDHWKPDPNATVCDEATCKRTFSYFVRRHHCRRCGNIFCDWHSSFEIPLDEKADYNPRGTLSRACSHCYGEFKSWRSRTSSQDSSITSARTANGNLTAPSSPTVASPTAINGCPPLPKPQEAAMSVPRDWNWSTF